MMLSPALRSTLIAAAIALLSATVLVALARPAVAAGIVEVRFVQPERFSDAGRNPIDRERALASLSRHLQALGSRLPAGQRLKVDVLDVDLAGEEVTRSGRDTRVLRGGADMPTIALRWSLEQGDGKLRAGEDRLTDLNYMNHGTLSNASSDDLPYEKALLTRWFRDRVLAAEAH